MLSTLFRWHMRVSRHILHEPPHRHYTFYLWRKVVAVTPWTPAALGPCYAAAAWLLCDALAPNTTSLWRLAVVVATALAVVPAGLLELRYEIATIAAFELTVLAVGCHFVDYVLTHMSCTLRYFTVPWMLVALHITPPRFQQLWLLLAVFVAVNIGTLYMFVERPFQWPDGSTARFMW